jgi:hypothetical protein
VASSFEIVSDDIAHPEAKGTSIAKRLTEMVIKPPYYCRSSNPICPKVSPQIQLETVDILTPTTHIRRSWIME